MCVRRHYPRQLNIATSSSLPAPSMTRASMLMPNHRLLLCPRFKKRTLLQSESNVHQMAKQSPHAWLDAGQHLTSSGSAKTGQNNSDYVIQQSVMSFRTSCLCHKCPNFTTHIPVMPPHYSTRQLHGWPAQIVVPLVLLETSSFVTTDNSFCNSKTAGHISIPRCQCLCYAPRAQSSIEMCS